MIIRPLSSLDIARSTEVHWASFEQSWDKNSLSQHIDIDICLGVFTPHLSGFIILRQAADQAEIITLAIDPPQRRKGLAQKLVEAACQNLKQRGAAVLFLEVAEDNKAAVALYSAVGFLPIGRRPAYYKREGGRVAALTYKKDLLE